MLRVVIIKALMQYICIVEKNIYIFPILGYAYKAKVVLDIMEIGM